ncbi:hypothetical protein [Sphingomonas sediminicola]|jgi:hypothetical protein|nr:hypothetical protein [Sphingomonas sediminicola]
MRMSSEAFDLLLDADGDLCQVIGEKAARRAGHGFSRVFGPLAHFHEQRIRRHRRELPFMSALERLWKEIVLNRARGVARHNRQQPLRFSLSEVALLNEVSEAAVAEIVAELTETKVEDWSPAAMLDAKLIQSVRLKIGHTGTIHELAAMLGVGWKVVLQLAERGVFQRVSGKTSTKANLFDLRAPRAFVAAAAEGKPTFSEQPDDLVSIITRRSQSIAEIVRAIQDGQLECEGRLKGVAGLAGLLVRDQQLGWDYRQYEVEFGLPIYDGGARLMMGDWAVNRLIEAGFLEIYPSSRNRTKSHTVTRRSLEAFAERYVSKAELAARSDLAQEIITKRMRVARIPCLEMNGSRFHRVFERERALHALGLNEEPI